MQKKFETWTKRHPVKTRRALEIIPGLVSWFLILFPIWGSFFMPLIVAYYILGFAVYWFYRAISVGVLALLGHIRLKASEAYDWFGDLKAFPGWKRVHHLIILPTYKEPLTSLRRSLKAIEKQTYLLEKVHVVLAFEEREGEPAVKKAKILKHEFKDKFGSLMITSHPDIEGEVKGKSSNNNWAARVAKKELVNKRKIKIERIIVTVADADSVLHPNFLACLSYHFLDHPNRYKRIWQPSIMFYNNIWKVPAPIRVLASIWSVAHIYLLMRTDMLINFSTYSTSLKMVVEVDYWDTDVIPEDWRFFF